MAPAATGCRGGIFVQPKDSWQRANRRRAEIVLAGSVRWVLRSPILFPAWDGPPRIAQCHRSVVSSVAWRAGVEDINATTGCVTQRSMCSTLAAGAPRPHVRDATLTDI